MFFFLNTNKITVIVSHNKYELCIDSNEENMNKTDIMRGADILH